MIEYHELLNHVLLNGVEKTDRTGTGTLSVFGHQLRFNLAAGFPLVTTKKIHLKSVIHELLWFLMGGTNVNYLQANGVHIWDEWADERGSLGPVYGKQWRSWEVANGETIDQLADVIETLKTKPDSRRLIVSAWNVADLPKMALMPCHILFQFNTRPLSYNELDELMYSMGYGYPSTKNREQRLSECGVPRFKLDCQLYQRSADLFLGVPFNIASYALLTHMVAHVCNMVPGDFVHTFGDVHIYKNHIEQVKLQLSRECLPLPVLHLQPKVRNLFDFTYEDIIIYNYRHHPAIKAPVAV